MADNNIAQNGFRTYIGLRYVPIIEGLWDITKDYEQLVIVTYEGNSYTSKKPVPAGVALTNTEYWVMTGNYNVQVANLQNEVEVAVRQILDYATDFERFKTDMMALYENFVVDADGKVLEKVEEYEHLIGEQYEAFIRYVNNALEQYRNDFNTFTEETNQRINDFINNTDTRIDAEFARYEGEIDNTVSNYYNETVGKVASLQNQVNDLVLQAGNPESSSAEIVQARAGYNTLNARLNAFNNIFMGYKDIGSPSGVIDFNGLDTIGIYQTSYQNMVLNHTPYGDEVPNNGFTVVVYADKGGNSFIKQVVTMIYDGAIKTSERYKRNGVWTEWRAQVEAENSMIFSYADYLINFNTLPANTCFNVEGYTEGNKPSHSPDFPFGEAYTVITYGYIGERTQFTYTGTNNRVFIRREVNGVWTNWDYLTTKDDVDSASATINAKINVANVLNGGDEVENLTALNALPTNKDFNIATLAYGILPSGSGMCYIFNATNGTNVNQIVIECSSGTIYRRTYNGSVWTLFTNAYDVSPVNDYNSWGSLGVALSALQSQVVSTPNFFTNKIRRVKFSEDITGDTVPNTEDTRGYLITSMYGDEPNTFIHLTYITCSGRIFVCKYTAISQSWSSFSSPYYTKGEVDALIQNI